MKKQPPLPTPPSHHHRLCTQLPPGNMADAKSERKASSGVRLRVEPRVCLHDVPTGISVSGLTPQDKVTLTLYTHNDTGQKYLSYAHYLSDDHGVVDVGRSEAVGGSFTGVFPAGLFSSLREFPFHAKRLQKDDPTKPWRMTLMVHEGHLTPEESTGSEGLADTVLERYMMGPGVRRMPVRHGRVRGTLYLPPGSGPFPAVLDVFGGFGGLKEYRASMLASKGFACLAIAYFNYDDLPKTLDVQELEYFEEAVEFLLSQPGVIPDRCGVLSSSKGSNSGLAMGIYLDKVTAIVCIGGMTVGDTTTTYKGHELWKGVKMMLNAYEFDDQGRMVGNENSLRKLITHDHPCMPPIENAPDDTHFLLVCGEKDNMHTNIGVEALTHRMKLHGRESQCHPVFYPGAGHIIEPPYSTNSDHSHYNISGTDLVIYWGGDHLGVCKAQEANWKRMREFFEMYVRDNSVWYQEYLGRAYKDDA